MELNVVPVVRSFQYHFPHGLVLFHLLCLTNLLLAYFLVYMSEFFFHRLRGCCMLYIF